MLKLPPTLHWVLHFDPGNNGILLTLQNICRVQTKGGFLQLPDLDWWFWFYLSDR